jgi:hypothetical protein
MEIASLCPLALPTSFRESASVLRAAAYLNPDSAAGPFAAFPEKGNGPGDETRFTSEHNQYLLVFTVFTSKPE